MIALRNLNSIASSERCLDKIHECKGLWAAKPEAVAELEIGCVNRPGEPVAWPGITCIESDLSPPGSRPTLALYGLE